MLTTLAVENYRSLRHLVLPLGRLNVVNRPMNATEAEQKVFDSSHDSMKGGWGGTFEQLEDYLKKVT